MTTDTAPDKALSVFNGRTLSYTYDNGWAFTNYFDGDLRISPVKGEELREKVVMSTLGPDLYLIAWVDAEMGPISQVVNLAERTVWAAVPYDGYVQIWPGKITAYE